MLDNAETGERRRLSGSSQRSSGFTFELPPRNGAIWLYRVLPKEPDLY